MQCDETRLDFNPFAPSDVDSAIPVSRLRRRRGSTSSLAVSADDAHDDATDNLISPEAFKGHGGHLRATTEHSRAGASHHPLRSTSLRSGSLKDIIGVTRPRLNRIVNVVSH